MTRGPRLALGLAFPAAVLAAFGVLYLGLSDPRLDISPGVVLANFREVDPGRFYRSGQLSGPQLHEVTERFGIRTVVNLRGYDRGADWYREEAAAVQELGLDHHDVHLSSRSLALPGQVEKLLAIYQSAERPILVHCGSGADRAGEATALYRIEVLGESPDEALSSLVWWKRHLAWVKPEKRHFIASYQGRDWLVNEYEPCAPESSLRPPSTCEDP